MAHAASAFYVSGFKEANIISMDGKGEVDSTVLAEGKNNEINVIRKFNTLNSIGALYESFTDYLGFRRHSHEGHVMGLASYGRPVYDTKDIIKFTEKGYSCETNTRYHLMLNNVYRKLRRQKINSFNELLINLYGPKRNKEDPITKKHENIAATIQNIHEKALVRLAQIMYDKNHISSFCLAGGSSLNCVANGVLLNEDFVKDIFIQPASNDAGTSIGAAFLGYKKLTGKKITYKMEHAYYGPEYTNEQILKEIKNNNLDYKEYSDISGITAELINKGKIVGWFQGRMEIGPRALGNRSILANPTIKDMKDKINLQVKHRQNWRPFCPSILKEACNKYFENYYPSPFMILNFRVKKELWNELPSVVHIDGTARPQEVEKKFNAKYYNLIKKLGELNGHPVVLNTSFNDHEEPIVCSPIDAIKCMKNVNLDYLAIGNYLIKNERK
jgi:carbamoyltransferase